MHASVIYGTLFFTFLFYFYFEKGRHSYFPDLLSEELALMQPQFVKINDKKYMEAKLIKAFK